MSNTNTITSASTTEQTTQRHRRESWPAEPYPTSSVPAATISSSLLSLTVREKPQDSRSNTRQPTLVSITLLFNLLIGTRCRHARKVNDFHTDCLRKLSKIIWQDTVPDTVGLGRDGTTSSHTMLCSAQLRWAAILPACQMRVYRRRSTKNWIMANTPAKDRKNDTRTPYKTTLNMFSIHPANWECLASDRITFMAQQDPERCSGVWGQLNQ